MSGGGNNTFSDNFDNPKNDNISISRDSESDFDRRSEAGYSHHGRKHCFDVNNDLSDYSNQTLSQDARIVCYYSDSDDGTFHSQDKENDDGTRSSGSDSDDTNTTDDGSEGTTYDDSYDSIGSDVYNIRPDNVYYYHHPRTTHHGGHKIQLAYPFSVLNPGIH